MGRSPCCDETGVKKGPWTPEEDQKLVDYVAQNGHGSWRALPKLAGLNRCGKSCRLRWTNYLRPDIKRGKFSPQEESAIIKLHSILGNKWSRIASHLPGRTDNEIKNFWNTHLRKKLLRMGIDPNTHKPRTDLNPLLNLSQLLNGISQFTNMGSPSNSNQFKLQAEIANLAKLQLLQNLIQLLNTPTLPNGESFPLIGSQNPNPNQFQTGLMPFLGSGDGFGLENGNSDETEFKMSDYIEDENCQPPPLISASPGRAASNMNQMDSETNPMSCCTNSNSPASSFFDSLENLMNDETSGSIWNDILQSTM